MADEGARLIATLEARVSKFERDLAKANGTARREFGAIETRSQQMANRLETSISSASARAKSELAGLGKSLLAGFAGGFAAGGLQGFVGEIRSAVRSMSELSSEAKRAGVGVEAFQELSYAARQNNVSVDALTDGLKELQLRADEFITTGKSSGAEAFQRLGYGADELKARLRDPALLFQDIIGRISALRDTAAGIRIADEIFGGTGGEQFVRFLEEGEGGIRRNIEEARRLGVVIDEDVVRKGRDLDRQFQKIGDTISSNLKNGVVGVATVLADWSTHLERFLNSIGESTFFKKLNDWTSFDWSTTVPVTRSDAPKAAGLDPKGLEMLRRAMTAAGDRAAVAAPDRGKWLPGTFVDPKLAGMRADFQASLAGFITAAREAGHDIKLQSGVRTTERQAELFAAAVRKYGSEAEARKWVAPPGRSYHEKGTAADLNYAGAGMRGDTTAAQSAREWAHANASRFGLSFPLGNEAWHVEPADQRGAPKDGDPDTTSLEAAAQDKAAAARKKVADAAAQQAEKVRGVLAALALESAQIGQTAAQQEILQRLQQAGVDLSSREGQAIAAKVQELYRLKAAQEAAAQSAEALKQARQDFADTGADATKGFVQDLKNGVSAADALTNALQRIADKILNSLIDNAFNAMFNVQGAGGGGIGGALLSMVSSVFGGALATGGPVSPGKAYIVGEKRPELFVPNASGRVLPRVPEPPEAPKMGSFAQPAVNVSTPPTTVNVIGAPAGARVEERDDGRRGKSIDVILDERGADAMSRPGSAMSQSLRSNYGAQPVVRRLG